MEIQTPSLHRPYYRYRVAARVIDFAFAALVTESLLVFFPNGSDFRLTGFVLYNFIVIFFSGTTLGRYALSLKIKSDTTGMRYRFVLFSRECLFFLASPVILLNLLFFAPLPIHDRICQTQVQRHETSPLHH